MNRRLIILVGVALVAALTIPSFASANTGSVKCDTTGVVFSFNANFSHDTSVTENVGGAIRIVTVQKYQASTDTWAGITGTISAGATWQGGSIRTTNLTCPAPPPPPLVTPTCPTGTTLEAASPGMLICIRTITNTVTTPAPVLPAIHDVVISTITTPAKQGKCPKYTRRLSKAGKPLVCGKDVIKWRTPKASPPKPIRRGAGVTG